MSVSDRRDPILAPGQARRLDPLCDRLEQQWLAGASPRLEEFLPLVEELDRPALLRELLDLELHHRARRGERPTAEEYRQRVPGYVAIVDACAAFVETGPATTGLPGTAS